MGKELIAGSGERLQVIYPGKHNRDRGPDFVGAIISFEGGVSVGDVEIHQSAKDWRSHGHHLDPGYNNVILQVVWNGETSVALQSGRAVPTLNLRHSLEVSPEELRQLAYLDMVPPEPCHDALERLGTARLSKLLDWAGEERFRLKAAHFAAALTEEPPSEVLYQGVMGALGYTKNKEGFRELARRLPLAKLKSFCQGKPYQEQVRILKALFLSIAGLSSESVLWLKWEPMSPTSWDVFRVRPENHPGRRLVGASYLLARFMDEGLLECVLRLVKESRSDVGRLEAGFMVGGENHCSHGESALIGQGRAREIAGNIALPFAFAWAEANSQAGLAELALRLYKVYPRLGENEITRGLIKLLGSKAYALVDSAQRQQGLLHLDKTFCQQRRCGECPLASRLAIPQGMPC